MSYRDKRKTQIESHHRVLSYDITKHIRQHQNHPNESSSQSSHSPTSNNFNSGQPIILSKEHSDNDDSQSEDNSDNETENFIRAEFSKYQVKPTPQNFKLFKGNASKSNSNTNPKDSVYNQETKKQAKDKKPIYQTTFFKIQIQDKQSNPKKQQQENQKASTRKSSRKDKQKALESSGYSQLEQFQRAIMRTLRQKEKQLSFLQSQLFNFNEQKLLNFSINRQVQLQLLQVKKKSSNVQKIKHSNGESSWKPQTVQQMKLMIENQRLTDQLAQLQQQELKLKAIHDQITDQQTVLRETLQKAFRTRKDYIKAVTSNNEKEDQTPMNKQYLKGQNTQISRQTLLKPKIPRQTRIHSSQTISKLVKTKQKPTKNKQKNTQQSNQLTQNPKISKQLSQMKEKELLLKLLQDFNELKDKVDQSLTIKSKNNSKTKSHKSTQIKPKRKVVYNNL